MGKKGFTLAELLIVLGLVSSLLVFTTSGLMSSQSQNAVGVTVDSFIADARQQQLQTMTGDTQGTSTINYYGIYFGTGNSPRYTLFIGSNYSPTDTNNFPVALDPGMVIASTSFSGNQIVFDKGNGAILNFINGQNTVTLRNSASGDQKIVTFNRYGVITAVN